MNQEKIYVRVTDLREAWLVEPSEVSKWENKTDIYASTVFYNQKHFDHFKKENSVAGIRDVNTSSLWFDFDKKDEPQKAQQDAIEVVKRLKKNDVPDSNINVYMSGQKGFHVIVDLDKTITLDEVKKLALGKYGVGLATLDPAVYLPTQVLRIPNSKHGKSGLYKVQLTQEELNTLSLDEIREIAKKNEKIEPVEKKKLPESFYSIKAKEEPKKEVISPTLAVKTEASVEDPLNFKGLDLSNIPAGFKGYKWAIAQGRFNIGERHSAMMVLCATCRALKYGRDMTEAICEKSDELHCSITGDKPMSDLQVCLDSVFGSNWNGGQYSPENYPWLKRYCEENGFETEEKKIITDRAFHPVSIGELYKTKNEKVWIAERFIAEGGLVILSASPKLGKSSLARQLTRCVLRGEDFLGRKVKKGSVIWLALEEQQEDLNAGFRKLGIRPDEDLTVHMGAPLSLKVIEDLTQLLLEKQPTLLIIDTLFDLIQVESEKEYNAVKTEMARLSHVARFTNTAMLAIHHNTKPGKDDNRRGMRAILGSQAILGKADAAVVMEDEGPRRFLTSRGRGIWPWEYREIIYDRNTWTYSLGPEPEIGDDWT